LGVVADDRISPATREAFIFEAVRTPRAVLRKGTSALAAVKPVQLLGVLFDALKTKRNVDPDAVDDLIVGCSTQA
jgi:acetyl-CoA C-acetyltransferase